MTRKLFSRKYTKRTRFTRQCIGEAIIALVYKKDFDSITISDIVKTAGVSRMTFYHYFNRATRSSATICRKSLTVIRKSARKTLPLSCFAVRHQSVRHCIISISTLLCF